MIATASCEFYEPVAAYSEAMMEHNEAPKPVCIVRGILEHLSMSRARSVAGEGVNSAWRWSGLLPRGVYPEGNGWEVHSTVNGRERRFLVANAVKTNWWTIDLEEVDPKE